MHFIILMVLVAPLMFTACSGEGDDGSVPPADPGEAFYVEGNFSLAEYPRDSVSVSVGSVDFSMIYANNQSSISFPIGIDNSGAVTLTRKFFMSETEVTNELMVEVLQWAKDEGKFDETGANVMSKTVVYYDRQLLDLDDDDCHIQYSDGVFSVDDTAYADHPVTNVTWFGAVMFCNWLTEIRDGNTDNVVYAWNDDGDGDGTASDGIWHDDETDEDDTKTGYRLPSTYEWEFAARYLGKTEPSTGGKLDTDRLYGNDDPSWTDGYYWTPGNYASGAYTCWDDIDDIDPFNSMPDNKDANDIVAVYDQYYDFDTSWKSKGTSDEEAVKSLGTESANALGLYDMAGNVMEWCFTKTGSIRVRRDGAYASRSDELRVGMGTIGLTPANEFRYVGFRLARSR